MSARTPEDWAHIASGIVSLARDDEDESGDDQSASIRASMLALIRDIQAQAEAKGRRLALEEAAEFVKTWGVEHGSQSDAYACCDAADALLAKVPK